MGLTPSKAPTLQRITVLDEVNHLRVPLWIELSWDAAEEEPQLAPLTESVDAGALRLFSSVGLHGGRDGLDAICSAALQVLRRSWLAVGQAPPPVMELALDDLDCPRAVLSLLPAGLTHLHLHDCRLELNSLTPVARQLPRLRMLGLDAPVSAAALLALLATAQQRDALTVHVWEARAYRAVGAARLTAQEVARLAALAAAGLRGPRPTPRVVWHAGDESRSARYAARCEG
jgi:hypothetical protein